MRVNLGVPYAAPPIGSRRFRAPQLALEQAGISQANKIGYWCPQSSLQALTNAPTPAQNEDCLTLNVYAPAIINQKRGLPVMVYVHGGGSISGSGASITYNGTNMINNNPEHPVVLVTFNYRLGALGWMAGDEMADEDALNLGLRDQAYVFKWVR